MRTAHAAAVAALGIVLVAGLVPAVAQPSMRIMQNARSVCDGMMQAMTNGAWPDGRWQTYSPGAGSMAN